MSDDHTKQLQPSLISTINYNNSTDELYNPDINTSLQRPKPAQAQTTDHDTTTPTLRKEKLHYTQLGRPYNYYKYQPSSEAI